MSSENTTAPVTAKDLQELAYRFTQPIGTDYASVMQQYSGLSKNELSTFWIAVHNITDPGQVLSKEQFLQAMDNILENKKRKSDQLLRPILPDEPTSCGYFYYNQYYYKDYSPVFSGPSISSRIVDYYQGDCDGIELTYNRFYNRIRPITPLGDFAIGQFLMGDYNYSNGIKTIVLHKLSAAKALFGPDMPAAINNNIRMSGNIQEM